MNNLEWTGERLITSVNSINKAEHLHRYAVACQFVKDKLVLDIACGEGYGSHLLSKNATLVIGVDISSEAVNHAKGTYLNDNLTFLVGSATDIPVKDQSIDVVVSFETLEHHDQHEKMFTEIKRVLKADGLLIISTPDKLNYTDRKGYINPFHIKELYREQFKKLISDHFVFMKLFMQNEFYGTYLLEEGRDGSPTKFYTGDYDCVKQFDPLSSSEYLLAIASDFEINDLFNSFYVSEKFWEEELNFLNYRLEEKQKVVNAILDSKPFKLGLFLLSPLLKLKEMMGK